MGFIPTVLIWDSFYPYCSHLRWDAFTLTALFWDEMVLSLLLVWDEMVLPLLLVWDETVLPLLLAWDEMVLPLLLVWDETVLPLLLVWDETVLPLLLAWDEMVLPLLLVWDETVLPLLLAWDEIVLFLLLSFEMRTFLSLLYNVKGYELTLFLNCNGELQILCFGSVFFSTCYICCALLLLKLMTSYSRFSRQKSIRMKWAKDFFFYLSAIFY